jgi:hypothetical protein
MSITAVYCASNEYIALSMEHIAAVITAAVVVFSIALCGGISVPACALLLLVVYERLYSDGEEHQEIFMFPDEGS